MKQTLVFMVLVFSISSCNYSSSSPQSEQLASDFFDGRIPPEVVIPEGLRGEEDSNYRVERNDFDLNGERIRIFFTTNQSGKLGKLYVDGFDLNTVDETRAVALKRREFIRRLAACGDSGRCAVGVFAQAAKDCEREKNKEHCWWCEDFGGDIEKGQQSCPR